MPETGDGSFPRIPPFGSLHHERHEDVRPLGGHMSKLKRRDFLKATAGVAAGGALGAGSALFTDDALAQQYKVTPEKGAKLRLLRWKRFVQGDEDMWAENTKKFTQATGIEVRIDAEGWEDVRPKAAVAANIGSGPDIIIGTYEDAHQYPEK